jgi:barstar (barnase inhibitor)
MSPREFLPSVHEMNLDAWIDCRSDLDGGMTRFSLAPGEPLGVEVADFAAFEARLPEVARALLECTDIVNERYAGWGDRARVILHLA